VVGPPGPVLVIALDEDAPGGCDAYFTYTAPFPIVYSYRQWSHPGNAVAGHSDKDIQEAIIHSDNGSSRMIFQYQLIF
jgi:hypothetical protein